MNQSIYMYQSRMPLGMNPFIRRPVLYKCKRDVETFKSDPQTSINDFFFNFNVSVTNASRNGSLHLWQYMNVHTQTWMYTHKRFHDTDSTAHAAPPKSTKSRDSNSSLQIQIKSKSQLEFAPWGTEESGVLGLVDFGDVACSVESVIDVLNLWTRHERV